MIPTIMTRMTDHPIISPMRSFGTARDECFGLKYNEAFQLARRDIGSGLINYNSTGCCLQTRSYYKSERLVSYIILILIVIINTCDGIIQQGYISFRL